jgi:RNA polymerase sigma-70 factor (ECF subfamily)
MPDTDMSDKQLAAMAAQGDSDSYRRLFERYQNPVYNFVYRLVNDAEDASDIVQNAFLRMYTVLGEKDVENFSAYLYRTARNLAYDEMRRRTRFAGSDTEAMVPEDPNIYADPQRALMLQEQIDSVRRAAARLNDNQREALLLRELQEFDYQQMSDVLGSNRNAVGALLSRARLSFREELRMAQLQTDQIPPDCEEIISLLSPYIDNELTEDQAVLVDGHLQDCTFCAAALEEMREASRSFRMLIPVIPPADMAQAFTGRLDSLAGQASPSGGAAGSTQPFQAPGSVSTPAGAGKRSLISRMVRGKALWISIAAVMVFASTTLLLAEDIYRENDISEPVQVMDSEPIETVSPVGVMPAVQPMDDPNQTPVVEDQTPEEVPPDDDAADDSGPATVPTDPGDTTTDGGGTPPDQGTTPQGNPDASGSVPGITPGYDGIAHGSLDRPQPVNPPVVQ